MTLPTREEMRAAALAALEEHISRPPVDDMQVLPVGPNRPHCCRMSVLTYTRSSPACGNARAMCSLMWPLRVG
jgi:hypothetical protein